MIKKKLNVLRFETKKNLLAQNIEESLLDIGLWNDFLLITSKAQVMKAKIGKWNYIKFESYSMANETINKIKSQPMGGKKYSPIMYPIKC